MSARVRTKWDVPPRPGQYDHLLREIRDEALRQTPSLPPPPSSERSDPGRTPRVRVEVELVERRAAPKRRRINRLGRAILWLAFLLLLASIASAQPAPQYDHWTDTNGWHGQTRQEGRTTDWDAYGPQGQQKHCHRYYVGEQAYTDCH